MSLTDLETMIVAIFIATGLAALALVLLVLLLPLAPSHVQARVKAGVVRWNEVMIKFLDRGTHAVAVVLVAGLVVGLIGAVIYLFARP